MNKKIYYERTAKTIIDNLRKRRMEGFYCENKEAAVKKALEIMEEGYTVGWGGSQTVNDIRLKEALLEKGYRLIDREQGKDYKEKMSVYSDILQADYFLMGSNAITLDGELINIDGRSDRVAFLCFGPRNVLVFVGMNKIVADVDSGIKRAQNIAASLNAMKLDRDTPCKRTGRCENCLAEECLCSQIVITRRSAYKNRIKVFLIGEELGF